MKLGNMSESFKTTKNRAKDNFCGNKMVNITMDSGKMEKNMAMACGLPQMVIITSENGFRVESRVKAYTLLSMVPLIL